MRHFRFAGLLALPLAAGSVLFGTGQVQAGKDGSSRCTTALMRGGYVLSGTGVYAGTDLRAIQTLVFDGVGKVSGRGTAVIDTPFLVVPFEAQDGTYEVKPDCTGTMRWFGHHPTLPVADHFHNANLVVGDGGRQMSLIYTSTEFPGGLPQPVESVSLSGNRM